MDYELLTKIITCIAGAIGAGKIFLEISIGKRGRMREQYEFAKAFLDEVKNNPDMHPFVREKGYRAIAGDDSLSAEEVEYLLSLQNSERALKDYVLGRKYLEHLPHIGDLQISFRDKYRSKWSRRWRIWLFTSLYVGLFILSFIPMFIPALLNKGFIDSMLAWAASFTIFGSYAWMSLKTASSIYRAEKLVEHQHKHTQRILLNDPPPSATIHRILNDKH